ncbi:MAG: hypothetical protein WC768_04920 [Patescibacteria group bacterium]|jgi:hypothetical protein
MLVPKKMKSSRKLLLLAITVIVLGVIIYLLYTNFIAGSIEIVKPLKIEIPVMVISPVNPELKTDFLNKKPYTDLKNPSGVKLPVTASITGRSNPFLPLLFIFSSADKK